MFAETHVRVLTRDAALFLRYVTPLVDAARAVLGEDDGMMSSPALREALKPFDP